MNPTIDRTHWLLVDRNGRPLPGFLSFTDPMKWSKKKHQAILEKLGRRRLYPYRWVLSSASNRVER